jgi:hypothetical protein
MGPQPPSRFEPAGVRLKGARGSRSQSPRGRLATVHAAVEGLLRFRRKPASAPVLLKKASELSGRVLRRRHR